MFSLWCFADEFKLFLYFVKIIVYILCLGLGIFLCGLRPIISPF